MKDACENRDQLTGLWRGSWVFERLENILSHNGEVALILIDIDRFKLCNDEYGLKRGDEEICKVAREMEALSGEGALIFRWGGDEFGIVLPEVSLEKARKISERIRAGRQPLPLLMWESKMTYDKKEVAALTLSLGIAHFPTHVSSAPNLLEAANLALLKAKDGGRLPNGTSYVGRNRVMAIGDFWDEFPEQSARFLRHEFTGN